MHRSTHTTPTTLTERISTGISGFDEVLSGGFVPQRTYLVRGGPGAGKTTLGLHFLTAGSANGEPTLYINLGEAVEQIRANAESVGFDLTGVSFLDLSPATEFFTEIQSYDVFSPAEVEREPITNRIISQVREIKPTRIFLDAMSHFRYLALDTFQFRRQVLSLLRFMVEQGATVVFTSESTLAETDDDLQYLADGIIELDNSAGRRTLTVTKFRGSDFRSENHSMRLSGTGMKVFPRIRPGEYQVDFKHDAITSGVAELDEMLHGGIERGTITILTGPTGVGKTTLGLQFMKEAASRGERSIVYTFEEARDTLLLRSETVNIPVRAMLERGTLDVVTIEPMRYTPDEFAQRVRHDQETLDTKIVMIDSISGYRLAMRGEDMVSHLHALCKYLQSVGVAVIIVNEIESITGNFQATEIGVSYIADNIIFLRYYEANGELNRSIGVLKKRLSGFGRSLRAYEITPAGIQIGKTLTGFRGILSGTPWWATADEADLTGDKASHAGDSL